MFGAYIVIFGHISPGGGFAGGSIFGASFILERFSLGKDGMNKKLSYENLKKVMCIAILLYGTIKGYSFLTGGLDIHAPHLPIGNAGDILSGGYIPILNILVSIIVAVAFYFIYCFIEDGEI
jgi:multicomponent Na+:H+ antiporter subunit B